ncbi:MAG: hypothetical protein JW751_08935 [Polyangiaceae bacterium]|nr:hypothetical protein [Polyangiaceae bacterium]
MARNRSTPLGLALVALLGGGTASCDPAPAAAHALPQPPLLANVRANDHGREADEALRRARFDLAVLAHELARERSRPPRQSRMRCPDATLRGAGGDPTLVLLARDDRLDRRSLVPLALLRELARDELDPVRAALGLAGSAVEREVAAAPSNADLMRAKSSLASLRDRPYVAEILLTAYAEPRIIRKVGALRSEWVPGLLAADLAVYERRSGTIVCQAPLLVRNHVADAPIAVRLRPSTRERLTLELGSELHVAGAAALAEMTDYLRWPTPVAAGKRPRSAG